MITDSACIFCKIVAGDIPCFKLWEDERTLAFMDINPANPGHALAIAKNHAPDIFSLPPADLAAAAATAQRVALALRAVLAPAGINLVQANGPAAAQSVPHLHIHILPRRADDGLALNWEPIPGDMAAIGELAARVRAAIV
ncbi:MAG: HIT domain-containing protein [Magnetospirillum sp. WYHS-4]